MALLSEVLSPLVLRQLKQAGRPGGTLTQTSLRLQRSTVRRCEQLEDDIKKHQYSPQPRQTNFLRMVLRWCQAQPCFQELLSSVKPANNGELGANAVQHVKI